MTAVASPPNVFVRILCAVDGTEESLAATRQAARLLEPGGALELVAVAETYRASHAGWLSSRVAAEIEQEAEAALARAAELSPAAATVLARGHGANVILHAAHVAEATLVVVGASRPPRARERVLGTIADEIVRRAECSVLVARRRSGQAPTRIVCGIDGSPQSLVAAAVADELGRRCSAAVECVAGLGGKSIDADLLGRTARLDPRPPVEALTDAALDADLVVVGSRGLHGILSLGSVSARVAARADCSVLVVRGG